MDFLTNRELEAVKGDREIINETLDLYKDRFASKLKGEYGEKMLQEINGVVTKEDKKLYRKLKRKMTLSKIKQALIGTNNDTQN